MENENKIQDTPLNYWINILKKVMNVPSETPSESTSDTSFKIIKGTYKEAYNKAKKNKNKHFGWSSAILVLLAGVAVCVAAFNLIPQGLPQSIILVFISIMSTVTAFARGLKSGKKYSETWVRHRLHCMDLELEFFCSFNKLGEYKTAYDPKELFLERFIEIERKNQERFEKNMMNFDK